MYGGGSQPCCLGALAAHLFHKNWESSLGFVIRIHRWQGASVSELDRLETCVDGKRRERLSVNRSLDSGLI
jgi:hypothetical protein